MIFKTSKKSQNNQKRRLEDQLGTQYTTIIESVEIEGTLNAHSSVLIGGKVKGEINSSGVVWILKSARIEGDINTDGLIVEGYVHGNVRFTGKAELRPGAQLKGDISCAKLSVSKDCLLEGKVEMREAKLQTFVDKRRMFESELNI